MPSASDLNRYHQDTEYFVRQLDDLLGASQTKGQGKPRLDPKTAQNRLQDLAKQIQGTAITNQDSEEIKILNELTQGMADPRSFTRSLSQTRNKFDTFKKKRDDLFRESVAVQADIEDKLDTEKTNIERARKTLDEAEKQLKESTKSQDGGIQGYNELSSDFKQVIKRRKDKIQKLEQRLESRGLSLEDKRKIQKELAAAIESAKPEINKFKEQSKELIKKAQQAPTVAEETDEEAATDAQASGRDRSEATDEEISTEDTNDQQPEAKASATPQTAAQATTTSQIVTPTPSRALTAATAAIAGAAVAGSTVAASGSQVSASSKTTTGTTRATAAPASAASTQVEVSTTPSPAASGAAATTEIEIQASSAPAPAAATGATIEVATDKLERAAQARGISVTVEATAAPQDIPPEIAEVAVAYQTHLGTVQTQTQLLREAQAGDRPDIDQQQIMARLEASYEAIGQERDKLKTMSQHAGTNSFQMLDRAMGKSENALLDVHSNLEKGVRINPANLSALSRSNSSGMAVSGGIIKSSKNAAGMAMAAGAALPISAAVASSAEAAKAAALMAQRSSEAMEEEPDEAMVRGAIPGSAPSPLAYRGPAPRPTPRMAPGTSVKPSAAMPLTASGTPTTRNRPSEGLGGDTPLTDQSIGLGGDEQRPSVLEEGVPLSRGPYAQGERFAGPMAGEEELESARALGGGEYMAGADLMSQQAREKSALAAQAMFTGIAGTALGSLAATSTEETTEEPDEQDELERMLGGGTGGESPLDRGRQMVEDKVKEKVEKEVKDRLKKELGKKTGQKVGQQAGQKAAQQAAQKAAQQVAAKGASASARLTIEGAEAVNTPDTIGITLAIMIIQMNIQMIFKYLMKGAEMVSGTSAEEITSQQIGENAGKGAGCITMFMQQTLAEDFLTIFLDCGLICIANPPCWVAVIVIGVIFLIVAGSDTNVQNMLTLMAGG